MSTANLSVRQDCEGTPRAAIRLKVERLPELDCQSLSATEPSRKSLPIANLRSGRHELFNLRCLPDMLGSGVHAE